MRFLFLEKKKEPAEKKKSEKEEPTPEGRKVGVVESSVESTGYVGRRTFYWAS